MADDDRIPSDMPVLFESELAKERPSKISRWHRWSTRSGVFVDGTGSGVHCYRVIFWAVIFELIP